MLIKRMRDAARRIAARSEDRAIYSAVRHLDARLLEDIGLERFGATKRARHAR